MQSNKFAFNYGKNVMILGKQGTGKTQLGIWIAQFFNKKNIVPSAKLKKKKIFIYVYVMKF